MRAGRTVGIGGGLAAIGVLAIAGTYLLDRHPVGNAKVPEPAKSVEPERYLGRWYEIARYEQRFERGCEGVTADYSLRSDDSIEVVNRCRKQNGEIKAARGIAKVGDKVSNAKLKVSFFRPFYGDYWILDHAEDYGWSIVGEPSGRYLWILAREPSLPADRTKQLIERTRAMGYDTTMLILTRQP